MNDENTFDPLAIILNEICKYLNTLCLYVWHNSMYIYIARVSQYAFLRTDVPEAAFQTLYLTPQPISTKLLQREI